MTQHCHSDDIPSWALVSEDRGVKYIHSVFPTDRVINGGMLLWTEQYILIRIKCFRSCHFAHVVKCKLNIDFDCLWFFNQQVGLMFAFMGYGKQQKNPTLPRGESAQKGLCCRISGSLKSQTPRVAAQLLQGWAQGPLYKQALYTGPTNTSRLWQKFLGVRKGKFSSFCTSRLH